MAAHVYPMNRSMPKFRANDVPDAATARLPPPAGNNRRCIAIVISLVLVVGICPITLASYGVDAQVTSHPFEFGSSQAILGTFLTRYCTAPLATQVSARLDAQLVQVHVLHRHGQRSAIHAMPGSRYNFSCSLSGQVEQVVSTWPSFFTVVDVGNQSTVSREWLPNLRPNTSSECLPGQLTNPGFEQLLSLGKQLRAAYSGIFPNLTRGLKPEHVYVRTTDYQRTRASSAALLTTMLSLNASGREERRFRFETYANQFQDVMTGVGLAAEFAAQNLAGGKDPTAEVPHACPKVSAQNTLQKSKSVSDKSVHEDLVNVLGNGVSHSPTQVADALYSAGCVFDSLPCGLPGRCVKPELAAKALQDADQAYRQRFAGVSGGLNATKLGFYPLLREIMDRIERVVQGDADAPVLAVLGGHDTVIAPIAAALGFYDGKWPPLASHIEFELWKYRSPSSAFGVRVIFNGRPVTASIPGCSPQLGRASTDAGALCPLELFRQAIDALLGSHQDLHTACSSGF